MVRAHARTHAYIYIYIYIYTSAHAHKYILLLLLLLLLVESAKTRNMGFTMAIGTREVSHHLRKATIIKLIRDKHLTNLRRALYKFLPPLTR